MTEEAQRVRPLVIAPALLAALIVLSSDAAPVGPVTPASRDALSAVGLTAIARHLAVVQVVRTSASYPATVAVSRDASTAPAELHAEKRLLLESLLALPPPVS